MEQLRPVANPKPGNGSAGSGLGQVERLRGPRHVLALGDGDVQLIECHPSILALRSFHRMPAEGQLDSTGAPRRPISGA
jgi:hypothetical protein